MTDNGLSRPTRGYVLDAHGGPEVLRLEVRATLPPGPGEVLVDVEVAGVNFADTMIRRGEYLRNQPLSLGPGSEAVGRISAVGAGVEVPLGARVAAWVEAGGAYADRVIVPAHRVYPVPDDLPAAVIAALFIQGTTADFAVNRFGRLQPGETLLAHAAAGGVGGMAVQIAKGLGARVLATASSDEKRAIAREHGADAVLDSTDIDGLTEAIRAETGERGCDVVVDGVGGPLFKPSLRALAVRGRYVIAGSASQEPALMDARHLLVRNQCVCGFILAHITDEDPGEPSRSLTRLCDLARAGRVRARVESLPLEDAAEAHRLMESRGVTGKLVLQA
jgi:NADPH2:quinone reductase